MPTTHVVALSEPTLYSVAALNGGEPRPAHIIQRRDKVAYVHYVGTDKRLDEWVAEERCFVVSPSTSSESYIAPSEPYSHSPLVAPLFGSDLLVGPGVAGPSTINPIEDWEDMAIDSNSSASTSKKRKRGRPPRSPRKVQTEIQTESASTPAPAQLLEQDREAAKETVMTEEEFDIEQHKQITARRNFENVHFGEWQVKTWYFSPYPITETEIEDAGTSESTSKIPGVSKMGGRSHMRSFELFAGGMGRGAAAGSDKAQLWVCQQCFKYMAEGTSYDLHSKYCTVDYPPGKRVYQRGAHSIWEVDGAQQKLYCQNLALFGKLFIDVKTLFFDLDNFLFYILTESTSKQDHILGYFSKEKNSYDDYNLATIMTLPPYQRKGYGMLMIEFSYELSRRAGKIGTPERPLSDLGLRSYLAYWVSTLVRFFRHVLSTLPANTLRITHMGQFPGLQRTPSGESDADSRSGSGSGGSGNGGSAASAIGNGIPNSNGNISASAVVNGTESSAPKKKKNKAKGWAGEVEDAVIDSEEVPFLCEDPIFTTKRSLVTEHNEDGSATTHVKVSCTLTDIARATNLRVDDAAFALNEVGLLVMRIAEEDAMDGDDMGGMVVLTRAMVEKVAKERNVKRPCIQMPFVRLP